MSVESEAADAAVIPDHQRLAATERATVAVVIPTPGRSARLDRCLESLSRQTHLPLETVVVVPSEEAMEEIARCGLAVQVRVCAGNASFSRMVNDGIASTTGEWVLLVNDDVVLTPHFLERLVSDIPPAPGIGMMCGKLLAADGRTIDSTGQFVSRAWTARERGYKTADVGQCDSPGYVFSVPGAAALYRRRMLEEIAVQGRYFDEGFGTYLEDLELGWRAQHAGWRAYYVPAARAIHARGSTTKSRRPRWPFLQRYYLPWISPALQARYIRNRYRLMARYGSPWTLLRDGPWILWYELRLWVYLLSFGRETLRAMWRIRKTSQG